MSQFLRRLARVALATLLFGATAAAQAQTEIQWWHSMTGALNDRVNELAKGFNESQKDYKVVPVYKGAYPESMAAAIAAFRAGNAPHILQVFEVGTAHDDGSAKGAIKPVQRGDARSRREVRPEVVHRRRRGVLHDPQGRDAVVPVQQLDARSSITTRTRSRRPASTRIARRRPGPR